MKRAIDLIMATLLLGLLSPVFVVVALMVWWDVGRPLFFVQVRPGLNGLPFRMFKFRTMRSSIDESGELLPDDQRLSRIGLLLRSLSLDELPEFVNVIMGEMSIVGPRPLLMEYLPLYTPEQRRRHSVRPGITGWAQIHGRNSVDWPERFRLDVWYVDNRSLLLDCKIMLKTLVKILRREGISQEGHVTMKPFEGEHS